MGLARSLDRETPGRLFLGHLHGLLTGLVLEDRDASVKGQRSLTQGHDCYRCPSCSGPPSPAASLCSSSDSQRRPSQGQGVDGQEAGSPWGGLARPLHGTPLFLFFLTRSSFFLWLVLVFSMGGSGKDGKNVFSILIFSATPVLVVTRAHTDSGPAPPGLEPLSRAVWPAGQALHLSPGPLLDHCRAVGTAQQGPAALGLLRPWGRAAGSGNGTGRS